MNNYFVNICARAFCNADSFTNDSNFKEGGKCHDKHKKTLEKRKQRWNNKIMTVYSDNAQGYYDFILKKLDKGFKDEELSIKTESVESNY